MEGRCDVRTEVSAAKESGREGWVAVGPGWNEDEGKGGLRSEDTGAGLVGARRSVAIASVLTAMALVVLDAAIANVALPTMARSLQVAAGKAVWVVTAYQTGLVMALLPCAALGESLGHRRVFAAGTGVFTIASVFCALSPSLPLLIAARFLQGLGGAAIMALGVALLRFAVAPGRLGAAIGWNALTVALASAAGPTVGAAVLSVAGWPWLFAVNLPLGVIALAGARALPDVEGTGRPLDGISAALNAGVFSAFVIGVELLAAKPAQGGMALGAAGLMLGALVRRERPKNAPLIPLDLLRNASFGISVIASVLCFSGVAAGLVALPFHLQQVLGLNAWKTGLFLTPWPLTVALTAPLAGRAAKSVSTARLCAAGGVLLATGLVLASIWRPHGQPAVLMTFTALSGLGFGLFNVPNNRNLFLSAPRERSGAAGGMQGTARLTGQATGALIMTLLFAARPVESAAQMGLWIGAALTLAGGVVSTLRAGAGILADEDDAAA